MPLAPIRKLSSARRRSADVSQSLQMADGATVAPNQREALRPGTANLPHRTSSRASSRYGQMLSPGRNLFTSSKPAEDVPTRRFSLMRFRFASDTQLATRYKEDSPRNPSPAPSEGAPAPTIGITAPPPDSSLPRKKGKRKFKPLQQSLTPKSSQSNTPLRDTPVSTPPASNAFLGPDYVNQNLSFEGSSRPSASDYQESSLNDDDSNLPPSLPLPRYSESSVPTQSNPQGNKFLNFARRKKKQKSLFPLPIKLDPPENGDPQSSIGASPFKSSDRSPASFHSPAVRPDANGANSSQTNLPSSPNAPILAPSSVDFSTPSPPLMRHHSSTSARSARSTPANVPSFGRHGRPRSGTLTSFTGRIEDGGTPTTQHQESGRNSMASTTLGRNSIAGIRSLTSRFRQHSDVNSRGNGSPGSGVFGTSHMSSNNNSFAVSRETLVVPERQEGETSGKYYNRLEKDFPKRSIALAFSKSSDDFSHDVLRSLMRTFKFYEEPMDLSLRRFLWEIKLPGESQQIDRVISSFAERYHECNPHIFGSFDEAYFIAYSLIILHSDLFNKNNKNKMQKHEYQKNTGGQGIAEEILGYFYDNIHYSQFIGQEEEEDAADGKSKSSKRKKSTRPKAGSLDSQKNGKVDPYDVILAEKPKLDILRPSLREVLNPDDSYNYQGTADRIDTRSAQAAFNKFGVLQVVSARSRPEAFTSPTTTSNPEEAQPGVVNIKVAKVGVVWRKSAKRRKTRSPWQEWGVVLTASQLFFFRDAGWARSLIHQYEQHQKHGPKNSPVVFKPQLEDFNADVKLPLFKSVALQDSNYRRHKYAFTLTRSGTSQQDGRDNFFEEVLLAETENEMNDWITKLNYAATFTTTGVGMRLSDGQETSSQTKENAPKEADTPEATARRDFLTPASANEDTKSKFAKEISVARKETMSQRIKSLEESIKAESEKLEQHLKIARHLEILAPFPPKTRNELLSHGARLSLTIKWCRYEIWRLKCHRDILSKDLDDQNHKHEANGNGPSSPATTSKSSALGRLNSKASAIINAQRTAKPPKASSSRLSATSFGNTSKESDIAGGIDKAFATPSETLSRMTTPVDGPFKLPPLSLGSGAFDGNSHVASSSVANTSLRKGSASSVHSGSTHSLNEGNTEEIEVPSTPTMQKPGHSNLPDDKANSVLESDREQSSALGSPDNRSKVRRSLHKTLRDSREMYIPQHQRSKRVKDSLSNAYADDATSDQDSGRISRGTGSFTVHGKKASVITVGSEWQQMPAEERLRLWKQSQRTSRDSTTTNPTTAIEDESTDYDESFHTGAGRLGPAPNLLETDTEDSVSQVSLNEGHDEDGDAEDDTQVTPRPPGASRFTILDPEESAQE